MQASLARLLAWAKAHPAPAAGIIGAVLLAAWLASRQAITGGTLDSGIPASDAAGSAGGGGAGSYLDGLGGSASGLTSVAPGITLTPDPTPSTLYPAMTSLNLGAFLPSGPSPIQHIAGGADYSPAAPIAVAPLSSIVKMAEKTGITKAAPLSIQAAPVPAQIVKQAEKTYTKTTTAQTLVNSIAPKAAPKTTITKAAPITAPPPAAKAAPKQAEKTTTKKAAPAPTTSSGSRSLNQAMR